MKKLYEIDPDSEVIASGNGYIFVTTTPDHPGKKMKDHLKTYVYKHVVVMENHLGRNIDPDKEEVHHKNENVTDNRLSNLELRSRSDHSRDHAKEHKFWKGSPRNKPNRKTGHLLSISSLIRGLLSQL